MVRRQRGIQSRYRTAQLARNRGISARAFALAGDWGVCTCDTATIVNSLVSVDKTRHTLKGDHYFIDRPRRATKCPTSSSGGLRTADSGGVIDTKLSSLARMVAAIAPLDDSQSSCRSSSWRIEPASRSCPARRRPFCRGCPHAGDGGHRLAASWRGAVPPLDFSKEYLLAFAVNNENRKDFISNTYK